MGLGVSRWGGLNMLEGIHWVVGVVTVIFALAIIEQFIVKRWKKSPDKGLLVDVFYVWAAQGPFENGDESTDAMNAAYYAVFKSEAGDKYRNHAASYDNSPATWERNRLIALESRKEELDALRDEALMYRARKAANAFNELMRPATGYDIQPEVGPDGFRWRSIDTETPIEREEREANRNEALWVGIGSGLLADRSAETTELIKFFQTSYASATGTELPLEARDIGKAYFAALSVAAQEPESEFALEFDRLTAHLDREDPY